MTYDSCLSLQWCHRLPLPKPTLQERMLHHPSTESRHSSRLETSEGGREGGRGAVILLPTWAMKQMLAGGVVGAEPQLKLGWTMRQMLAGGVVRAESQLKLGWTMRRMLAGGAVGAEP